MRISSKFNWWQAFILPGIVLVLVLGSAYGLSLKIGSESFSKYIIDPQFWAGIIFFITMLTIFEFHIETCKKVVLDQQGITITTLYSSVFIPWRQVKIVNLRASQESAFQRFWWIKFWMDTHNLKRVKAVERQRAVKLTLRKGKKKVIMDTYYSNMPELRQAFKKVRQAIRKNKPVRF